MACSTLIALLEENNYKPITKARKSYITYEGYDQAHTFVLKEGIVRTSIVQKDGRRFNIDYLKGPDIISILKDEFSHTTTSPFSIRVESDFASFYPVPRVAFWNLVNQSPLLQQFIKDYYRQKLNLSIRRQQMMLMNGKIGAICVFLYYMTTKFGQKIPQGCLINMVMTNEDIGGFCGISTPNSVNRILHKLREEGVIVNQDKKILVKNLAYLKQYIL